MEAVGLFLGTLMQSRTQAHVYHLQSQGVGSDAMHRALQAYYEGIVPVLDKLAEGIQGRYGIITGYKMADTIREDNNARMYFDGLCKFVETIRKQIPQDSYIQNQVDEIVELIEEARYRLKFLQ